MSGIDGGAVALFLALLAVFIALIVAIQRAQPAHSFPCP